MEVSNANNLLVIFLVALALTVVVVYLIVAATSKRKTGLQNEPITLEFPDKKVKATVGWQGYKVRILRLPSPPFAEMPIEEQAKFKPRKLILNLAVAHDDDPDQLVTHFEPPLKIEFGYSKEDLEIAHKYDLEYPLFWFWDGCKWVLLTREKHQLAYTPAPHPTDELAGFASIELKVFADPPFANGP